MTVPLLSGARWGVRRWGESAPINRQVRTKFAMKIDQVSCRAHHLYKIGVQGARILAALWGFRAGGAAMLTSGQRISAACFSTTKKPASVKRRGVWQERGVDGVLLWAAPAGRPPGGGRACVRPQVGRTGRDPAERSGAFIASGSPPPAGSPSCRRGYAPREPIRRACKCASVDKPSGSVCSFLDQKSVIAKDLNRQDCVAVFPASNITARPIKTCNSPVNGCSVSGLRIHP